MNDERGRAPLYGYVSTKDINQKKVVIDTGGNWQGFDALTTYAASNHGGVRVTLRENGDCHIETTRHKSRIPDENGKLIKRGVHKTIMKFNLRDWEEAHAVRQDKLPFQEELDHWTYAANQGDSPRSEDS